MTTYLPTYLSSLNLNDYIAESQEPTPSPSAPMHISNSIRYSFNMVMHPFSSKMSNFNSFQGNQVPAH